MNANKIKFILKFKANLKEYRCCPVCVLRFFEVDVVFVEDSSWIANNTLVGLHMEDLIHMAEAVAVSMLVYTLLKSLLNYIYIILAKFDISVNELIMFKMLAHC